MTAQPIPAPVLLIPETAPFSPEQRAWLSGFIAAALLPDAQGVTALTGTEAVALGAGAEPVAGPTLANNDDAPWHDPSMPMGDRMRLAADRPMAPKLMAAMAQQDCGQCGYNCADYANAIFEKKEARLNLCAPGGKETARLVKQLFEDIASAAPAGEKPAAAAPAAVTGAPGTCREAPVELTFVSRRRLNGDGSEKDTWHIEFDLTGSGLDYAVGDSIGIFPTNHLGLVDQVIAMLGASHVTEVRGRPLRDVLTDEVSLGLAPDSLYELMSFISGGKLREKARALARGEDPDGDAAQLDVLAALHRFASVRPHPEAFVDALDPLQPRLYSISSSPRHQAGRLSLTVDAVRYMIGRRKRLGTASTFLADRIAEGARLRAYIQKAHNFALPADPATPIIMVGPGTGVAPFRAFLQERDAIGAQGRNWLFFGHQRQMTDFFYREELDALQSKGVLTRLSLAWSRDGAEKFYVQDRMREVGSALWSWLAEGAHFYICGDAKRMARDVEVALVDIVAQHGARSTDEAVAFVANMKKTGRYQADVY